ncbi:hypothetical protein [Pseudomonas sp. PIC25]|nr:hypothetical protein [Pseudomonas sp. PIC25]
MMEDPLEQETLGWLSKFGYTPLPGLDISRRQRSEARDLGLT